MKKSNRIFLIALGSLLIPALTACGSGGGDSTQKAGVAAQSCDAPLTVTPIPLCPGINGTQFHELLMKIGNQLYVVTQVAGVQSLTARPAGSYTTTDGRTCNYSISPAGAVSFF